MDKSAYRRILPLLDMNAGQGDRSILHLECGTGGDLKYMSTVFGEANRFFGVDRSTEAIDNVDPAIANDENFYFRQYDISKGIPFDYNFFDVVYGNGFLESIEDKEALVREIYRVAKDGARIILFEKNRESLGPIVANTFFAGFIYVCKTGGIGDGFNGYVYVGNKL
ncbi:MAG: methyltransferase domain-containing protein [Spirochaetes bacterium]|nr:methyltransferase domain-containing protein [Spirochaetota bacterium]